VLPRHAGSAAHTAAPAAAAAVARAAFVQRPGLAIIATEGALAALARWRACTAAAAVIVFATFTAATATATAPYLTFRDFELERLAREKRRTAGRAPRVVAVAPPAGTLNAPANIEREIESVRESPHHEGRLIARRRANQHVRQDDAHQWHGG